MISILIPVRDGGAMLRRCLEAIAAQSVGEGVEVVIVDSGSTDGSVELARSHGARVETIPPADFSHGGTRNLAASMAQGDVLVFTTQDAVPERDDWLAKLTGPLRAEPQLAGVYGRQLPRADAPAPERFFLDFLYGRQRRTQRAATRAELTVDTVLFSNVNSAIRHELWERFRFAEDIAMAEDQEWAARALLAGYALRYEPEAAVRHSHSYTLRSAFHRFYETGAAAERGFLPQTPQAKRALRRRTRRYAREEVAWLIRTGQAHKLPYAALYELSKYAGLTLGANQTRLPERLRQRLESAEPPRG